MPSRALFPPFTFTNALLPARVAVLFQPRRPAHVARLVVAVVIDAIERVLRRRSRSDMGEEGGEARAPFVANANSATAVVLPEGTLLVFAAIDRLVPGAVLRRHGLAATKQAVPLHVFQAARS